MNAAHDRRRTARVRLVAATTAVATTMLLTSGAAAARARPAKFDPTGVIHVAGGAGTTGGAIHFDPVASTTAEVHYPYQALVYEGLLRRTARGGFEPGLARKATVVDPQTIDVQLRNGAVFSDGTPFDPDAVKFGLERNKANAHGQFRADLQHLQSVERTGPSSLRIHLDAPVAGAFYPLLGGQESFISSPAAVRSGANLDEKPVGAGPFLVKSYEPDSTLVYVKNPKYYDAKKIRLAGIEFSAAQPGPSIVNALVAGTADYGAVALGDVPALRAGGLTIHTQGSDDALLWFPICKTIKPFDDRRVRQALNYALDRDQLNQALFDGAGEPAWALWPKASRLFPAGLDRHYAYSPTKARRLLARAGYPKGFHADVIPAPTPLTQRLAEVVQAQWRKVGIDITIKATSNYTEDFNLNHKAPLGANPVLRPGLAHLTGPFVPGDVGDVCDYSNADLNRIAEQLRAAPSGSSQEQRLWEQAQQIVVKDEALGVFALFGPVVTAWNAQRLGDVEVIPGPVNFPNYWKLYVKKR